MITKSDLLSKISSETPMVTYDLTAGRDKEEAYALYARIAPGDSREPLHKFVKNAVASLASTPPGWWTWSEFRRIALCCE
jgi:hypothetical protein